jgi:predicted O-methyltransferase YrrM
MISRVTSFLLAIGHLYGGPQSFLTKSILLTRIVRNRLSVTSATGFVEQLTMISALLRLPSSVPGAVVECGTYMGGTTVNLSHAAKIVGRRLYVFDSFEGLPEPEESDARHLAMNVGEFHVYNKGSWCGPLETVKANIEKYGDFGICTLVKGYFDSTLPTFTEPIAFVFCDVDLRESLKTCVSYLWPRLSPNGILFTHEAHHHEIASLFFDPSVWNGDPPGLIGAGSGLGLSPMPDGTFGSCLGYTVKRPSITMTSIELGKRERYKTNTVSTSNQAV